jgi:hypothetical protein
MDAEEDEMELEDASHNQQQQAENSQVVFVNEIYSIHIGPKLLKIFVSAWDQIAIDAGRIFGGNSPSRLQMPSSTHEAGGHGGWAAATGGKQSIFIALGNWRGGRRGGTDVPLASKFDGWILSKFISETEFLITYVEENLFHQQFISLY